MRKDFWDGFLNPALATHNSQRDCTGTAGLPSTPYPHTPARFHLASLMVSQPNLSLPTPEAARPCRIMQRPCWGHSYSSPRSTAVRTCCLACPDNSSRGVALRCRHQLGPQPPDPPHQHPAPLYSLSNSLPSPSPKQRKKGRRERKERKK